MTNKELFFLRMYTGRDRFYHGVGHILDLLTLFEGGIIAGLPDYDVIQWKLHATVPKYIKSAILAHDCVYDATRKDNEELSALTWKTYTRFKEYDFWEIDYVSDLIMATKTHNVTPNIVASENDQAIIIGLDLAGLASDWDVFNNNTNLIRQEFAHVSDEDWKQGRSAWFKSMLAKDRIYPHEISYRLWETRAKENIQRGYDLLQRD